MDKNLQILQDKLQDNLQDMIQNENLQKKYPEQQFAKVIRNAYLHFWKKNGPSRQIANFARNDQEGHFTKRKTPENNL